MVIYYILMAAVLLPAIPLCVLPKRRAAGLPQTPETRARLARLDTLYLGLVFGLLLALSALRSGIGNDYLRYAEMFDLARGQADGLAIGADMGFVLFLRLLTGLGLSNRAIFALLAFLCLAPVAWFIGRYSPCVWMSCWLYICLTFFYGTLNFIRQNLALGLLLLGWPLLTRHTVRATALYCLLIGAACLLHTTALILLPVAWLLLLPLNRWTLAGLALADLLAVRFSRPLLDLFALRKNGEYYFLTYHVDRMYLIGLRPVFLVLPALVTLLVLLTRPAVLRRFGPAADTAIKLTLAGAVCWSFITRFYILERFSLFGYSAVLLSVPAACRALCPPPLPLHAVLPAEKRRHRWQQVRYGAVVLAVVLAAGAYNLFGMRDGFHGVFPYRSWWAVLNRLG